MNELTMTVRLMLRRDYDDVVYVEESTFGDWNAREFQRASTKPNCASYVAVLGDKLSGKEAVVGFAIVELIHESGIAIVSNMASTVPDARKKLLEKINAVAARHRLILAWEE